MFSPTDTIVAIATPPGRGGIGVVRVSGPSAVGIAQALLSVGHPLAPRVATLATVRDAMTSRDVTAGSAIDQVLATHFLAPASYTGEDVVEISAHGSPPVLTQIVEAAICAGARLAEPGEFTFRAYLNGRLDLVQAEAVADLIEAVTPRQARAAYDQLQGGLTRAITRIDARVFDLTARVEASLDFPDEGYHFVEASRLASEIAEISAEIEHLLETARAGRIVREGAQVVIAGKPNVGKSSLFNQLAGAERAIVTAIPGTTRDLITEIVTFDGLPVTLVDTAGIHPTEDEVEQEGVSRAQHSLAVADLVLVVLDGSAPLSSGDEMLLASTRNRNRVVAMNKMDIATCARPAIGDDMERPVMVSALTGAGIGELRNEVVQRLCGAASVPRDTTMITNVRHIELLHRARGSLARAAESAQGQLPEELVMVDLQDARKQLEEVTGVRTSDDILSHIFARFCIGK